MNPKSVAICALIGMTCTCVPPVTAGAFQGSRLAVQRLHADHLQEPTLIFAQRTITREWGLSEDSLYTVIEVPEWRSETIAAGLSAVVPGTGQYYVRKGSGFWFALVEAAAWTGHLVWREDADDARLTAAHFAGDPNASASNWSFDRWGSATSQDPGELRALHRVDPNSFYLLIGHDPHFAAGWAGASGETLGAFQALQEQADDKRRRSRIAAGVIWLNHIVAAAHAFRAARLHNLPLQRNLELQLKPTWNGGAPGMMAVVEKTF
jgi:hypothetical protein